ncbi:MAG: hypothetical protein WAV56_02805 [Microgenomates group bacterium]
MGKTRNDSSVVFGRSLALLLVALFVLTGTQMGLSLVRDPKGTVLGEDDDEKGNKWWNKHENVSPTATPTAAPTTQVTTTPTTYVLPTATPTVEVTAEPSPTAAPTTQVTVEPTTVTTTPTAEQSSGQATTTTTTSQPSAGDTVRTILRQIGLPVSVKPTPTPEPEKITTKEEVINERQAGEILKELESTVGTGVVREVRLRFVADDGGVGLRAEVRAGQGVLLSVAEVTKISETLRLGSGLKVDRGSGTELVFSRGTAKAATNLPLLVDLDSNSLMVETSLGIRNVAVLPDTAVSKAVALGAVTDVAGEAMSLIERDDGKIAYRTTGQAARKLFGLFGIKSKQTVEVSAESGRVLPSLTDSLSQTLFNLIAPTTNAL